LRQLFTFFSQITAKSHYSEVPMLDFTSYCCQFTPIPVLKWADAVLFPVGNTQLYENIDFTPSGKQPRTPATSLLWLESLFHSDERVSGIPKSSVN
jgi:hypothetical protein